MRLVDGFLEEDPEERAKRQRRRPAEKQGGALEGSATAEASITSAESSATGSDVSTLQMRPEVSRVGRDPGPDSPRDMPGRTTWMESRTERARLARLVNRRLWSWIIVFGALFAIFVALIVAIELAHIHMLTIELIVTSAPLAGAFLAVCAITIEKSTFDRRAFRLFDPIAQDRAIWSSLEYGDPRGDGLTGAYVTRPDLRRELKQQALDFEEGKGGRRWVRRLLGTRHLPDECQGWSVLSVATETALRRWWDLGLLEAVPVVDRGDVRLVFSGIIV
jgi:hypothetical protein